MAERKLRILTAAVFALTATPAYGYAPDCNPVVSEGCSKNSPSS